MQVVDTRAPEAPRLTHFDCVSGLVSSLTGNCLFREVEQGPARPRFPRALPAITWRHACWMAGGEECGGGAWSEAGGRVIRQWCSYRPNFSRPLISAQPHCADIPFGHPPTDTPLHRTSNRSTSEGAARRLASPTHRLSECRFFPERAPAPPSPLLERMPP